MAASAPGPRELAQILWNEGADVYEIGFAFRDGANLSLATLADALDDQLGRSYTLIAKVLWKKLGGLSSRELAQILWNEGADVYEIGFAFRDGANLSLATLADALDDQLGRSYTLIAKVLWKKLGGLNSRELAQILWNEGADVYEIGFAFRDGANLSLATLADALDDQLGRSYTLIAKVLWKKLGGLNSRKLAQILWDEGANVYEIGFAFRDGANLSLATLADALDDQLGRSYTLIAKVLWNGLGGLNARTLASLIANEGASFGTTVSVLMDVVGLDYWDAYWIVDSVF